MDKVPLLEREPGIDPQLARLQTNTGTPSITQFVVALCEPPFVVMRTVLGDAAVRFRPPPNSFATQVRA